MLYVSHYIIFKCQKIAKCDVFFKKLRFYIINIYLLIFKNKDISIFKTKFKSTHGTYIHIKYIEKKITLHIFKYLKK